MKDIVGKGTKIVTNKNSSSTSPGSPKDKKQKE